MTNAPVTPGVTVPPTRPDPTIRTNSPPIPPSSTSTRERSDDGWMDGEDPEDAIVRQLRHHRTGVHGRLRSATLDPSLLVNWTWEAWCRCGWGNRYWKQTDAVDAVDLHLAWYIVESLGCGLQNPPTPVGAGAPAEPVSLAELRERLAPIDAERAAADREHYGEALYAAKTRRDGYVQRGLMAATGAELVDEVERRLAP